MKRLFDLNSSDIPGIKAKDLLRSIEACEGRAFVSEIIAPFPAVLGDISNPELAAAFGADIILLNMFDLEKPFIFGIEGSNPIESVLKLTGKIVAVNLEPIDSSVELSVERSMISSGRTANLDNVKKLRDMGCKMIVLTGNPATGVSTEQIAKSVVQIRKEFGDEIIIISGKMHNSGVISETGSSLIDISSIDMLIDAGSDVVLLPAPGTIPGYSTSRVSDLISHVHNRGKLVMTAIGTSQEGADLQTIRTIAINSKMAGADIHHIGDCGMSPGIASPENIMAYSIAIRGKRHTYRVMSRSVNR